MHNLPSGSVISRDSWLASTRSRRICQGGGETQVEKGEAALRASSTGELYGRSRSHVVVERVAVVEVERNPHAVVEVVFWMRDRDLPLNGDITADRVGSFGLIPASGVSGVSVIQAATISISR